jgi:predicted AlkP superfamily phosphohydrolase/phosphomutase
METLQMMQEGNSRKVFILGLDGATFDIMMPMIDRGKLPTFSKLMKKGVHCKLRSTIVSNSAPAWTSFATGKNPGKHSITGFFRLIPGTYQLKLLNGEDNRTEAFWDVAGRHGKKSIVMNIPMTYPPRRINGLMVSGLDTPSLSCDFTYPPELKAELLKVVSDYKINLHLGGYLHNNRRRRKAIDMMLSCIRSREQAVLYLMRQYPWDIFAVRFNSPDNVQHQFWRFMDASHPYHDPNDPDDLKNAILRIYEELDKVTASILEKLPPECTLLVMSDHGAGPRTNKTVRLNDWLKGQGYLTSKVSQKRSNRFMYKALERAVATFLKRVPPGLKQWIVKVSPETVSKTWTYFRFPNIDWERTKVFVGETEGIRINLKGAYQNGTVDPSEYDALRGHIMAELDKLKDPASGEKVFEGIFRREDVFSGPYVREFPDIIALTTKDQYNISIKISQDSGRLSNALIAEESHWRKVSGSHRREGILMICCDQVRQHESLPPSDITDVCPTVLYLLGLPLPVDLDGRVITEAFDREFLEGQPVRYEETGFQADRGEASGDAYTEEEREELVSHLRGLGYIE